MKKIFVVIFVCLLTLSNSKLHAAMPDATFTKEQETDLTMMFDSISKIKPNQKQFDRFMLFLDKLDESKPEEKVLTVRTLYHLGFLSRTSGNEERASHFYDEALKRTTEMKKDSIALGWLLDAECHVYMIDTIDFIKPDNKIVRGLEHAIKDLDSFSKNAKANAEDIKNSAIPLRIIILTSLTSMYSTAKEYGKSLESGLRFADLWETLDDEAKSEYLYHRYYTIAVTCNSAQKRGLYEECKEYVKDIENFLGNASEEIQAGKLKADEDTRKALVLLCTILMDNYADMHDFDRSEELATLAFTFNSNQAPYINYERCETMLKNGEYDDARKLYAEVVKDNDFVDRWLKYDDPVKTGLDALDKNGGKQIPVKKMASVVVANNQPRTLINPVATHIDKEFSILASRKRQQLNGRIQLPIDRK